MAQYDLSLKSYREALAVDPRYWNADTAKRRVTELAKKSSKN